MLMLGITQILLTYSIKIRSEKYGRAGATTRSRLTDMWSFSGPSAPRTLGKERAKNPMAIGEGEVQIALDCSHIVGLRTTQVDSI